MDNEKLISPYVESQFPRHYRENSPQFVEFVRMYYAWLEQSTQPIGQARRMQEYRDIDETTDDFITYFKNKFLPYLKFVTNIDKRALVKHVQDLYRSKGTERGVDLFFKLVYGVPADVYYPSTDLFRLSDNTWVKRNYLEIGHLELINDFIGKKIKGTRSGATAFAERFVQKKVGTAYVNLLFISNIEGNFRYNEKLTYDGLVIADKKRPKVLGSLSRLDITSGGKDFSVGDLVTVESEDGYGYGAKARVAAVYNSSGTVDFNLVDGGWGYSSYSNVYISEKLMTIVNVVPDYVTNNPDVPEYGASPFFTLEGITQPFNRFDYVIESAYQEVVVTKPAASWYSVGATIYQRDSLSVNVAIGTIISNSAVNSTAQSLVVSVDKSQVDISDFYITTAGAYSNIRVASATTNSEVLSVNASINTATIAVDTVLTSYDSLGAVEATVEIVETSLDTDKAGNLFVYILSGDPTTNSHFWAPSNTYSINVEVFTDKTASGNVVAFGNNLIMYISNSAVFSAGQYLTQRRTYPGGYDISARGKISTITYTGNKATVGIKDATGVFRPNVNVYMQTAAGAESGLIAYLNSYDGVLGVANIQNDFITTGNNKIFSVSSNSVANLVVMSTGKNATFEINSTFAYAESYSVYTDRVGGNNELTQPYLGLNLTNTTAFSNSLTLTFTAGNSALYVAGGTADIDLGTNWQVSGIGITDFSEILSKNTTHITVDKATWKNSSGLYYLTPMSGIAWHFPKNELGTWQFAIGDVLQDITGYVGAITKLDNVNPGEDYNQAPFVLIRDPFISGLNKKDFVLTALNTNVVGNFVVGEQVTTEDGAIGQIKSIVITATTTTLYVRRQTLLIDYVVGDTITGSSTAATAVLSGVAEDDSANVTGLNAIVTANVVTANGIVGSLEILSSGFSFKNDEGTVFTSEDGSRSGTAKAKLIKEGVTDGVFMDEASFASSGKYLFDGNYYQEYSYDILSPIPRETYQDNYLTTMHLAGTKMFSTFVHTSQNDLKIDVSLPELTANVIADIP